MNRAFSNEYVAFTVKEQPDGSLYVQGRVIDMERFIRGQVIAPSPIDRLMNYSGSGLPFPCANIAFDNTPNVLAISPSGDFQGSFLYPNSFYTNNAITKVLPSIFVNLFHKGRSDPIVLRFELPERAPLSVRTLNHRPKRNDPSFYTQKDELIGVKGAQATMEHLWRVKVYDGLA